MKNLLLLLALIYSTTSFAGGGASFEKTMVSSIEELYANENLEGFDIMANKFSRIGDAEKDQWLPYYYASLSYVFKAFRIEDLKAKDVVLDQALGSLEKASNIDNNVETVAMQGFINMIKIGVDPATRGQTLSPGIYADFGKAIQMDNKNPRAVLFMAQMQFGTAQFFGKGLAEACDMVEQSVVLFDTYEPSNAMMPMWGKPSALQYQGMCSEKASN